MADNKSGLIFAVLLGLSGLGILFGLPWLIKRRLKAGVKNV
jgi:hypothetical protein